MNDIEFTEKILTRYERKDGANREKIISELNVFCNKCAENYYSDMYDHCVSNIKYFNVSKMFEHAREQGFITGAQGSKKVIYWNKCSNCGAEYSKQGRGCPKCRVTTASIVTGDTLPSDIIEVQEDCFYCAIYRESVKRENERKMYFRDCNDYGVKQSPQCSACQCKECCRQMIMYNADPKGTTEKYKSTELAQPWVYEVQPLNETVKQMIADIAKKR